MIRRVAAAAAAAVAVLATSSSAAPPHLTDPKGDWHVPSQDAVSASLATARGGNLVVSLRLAAPLAELPGYYYVVLYRGCDVHVLRFGWLGPAGASDDASVETSQSCGAGVIPSTVDPRPGARTRLPAAAKVVGDTITWTLPVLPGLAKGARIDGTSVLAMPNPEQPVGFWSNTAGVPLAVTAFDIAYSDRIYVVGG